MAEVIENGERLADDFVGFFALDVNDKTNAARVVFEPRIIKALPFRRPDPPGCLLLGRVVVAIHLFNL